MNINSSWQSYRTQAGFVPFLALASPYIIQPALPAEMQQRIADSLMHLQCKTNDIHSEKQEDCIPKSVNSNKRKKKKSAHLANTLIIEHNQHMTHFGLLGAKNIKCFLCIGAYAPHSQATSSASNDATARRAAKGRCHCGTSTTATAGTENENQP